MTQTLIDRFASIATLILWCGLIFYLSNQPILPSLETGWQDFLFKKAGHVTVYCVLYILARRVFDRPGKSQVGSAAVFGVLYAISDEVHQSFVPGRTPMITDVLIDCVGMLLGHGIYERIFYGKVRTIQTYKDARKL